MRPSQETIQHDLSERVKELTLLHASARILQDDSTPPQELLERIIEIIPFAWQYPEITVARIHFGEMDVHNPNFVETAFRQSARFSLRDGSKGLVEVCYLVEKPSAAEGPFLAEEQDLIDSLAEMIRAYLQRKSDDAALKEAYTNLERQVERRTSELVTSNRALQQEIAQHNQSKEKIEFYQKQLRGMSLELSLTEERERRAIAADLHDHLGQALAYIKMKLSVFAGNTIFCGFENDISEIAALLNQAISYTRSLTFEISPPLLYEIGLEAALIWLAEDFQKKHKLGVKVNSSGTEQALTDVIKVLLYKSVRELLINVIKHAEAKNAIINISHTDETICLSVADDGIGFGPADPGGDQPFEPKFGLFSIKERLRQLGGTMKIDSNSGQGTIITLETPIR